MMGFLYQLGITLYWIAANIMAVFNEKACLFVKGRTGLFPKIEQDFKQNTHPIAWFHCASLGEFEQGRPVLEAFREEFPTYKILLTFFSPSGYEIRKNYPLADFIYYLPIDTATNAKRFVQLTQPSIAFFVKYEFWHQYTKAIQQATIPLLSISAIFRPNQLFFKSYGGFYRNVLHRFSHIFTQNETSYQLLQAQGIREITLGGDTRFDRVFQVCEQKKEIEVAQRFKNDQPTLVIGSAWKSDITVIAPILDQFNLPLKLIIAPHEIGESNLKDIERAFPSKTMIRYSKAANNPADLKQADVLMIDNIGLLSSLYQYGDFAYIGGAFGKGLHNILEAATFGMPLVFGPTYDKFQEAIDLTKLGGAFPIKTTEEFKKILDKLYNNKDFYTKSSEVSWQYVRDNLGATSKIIQYCKLVLR
ncbi:MAG: 3-deoxy-D-manno-octulosonic acid transferase [Flammeovirgaceae bacterium]